MILHLTRDFPPRINGGLSTAVGQIVDGLEAAGIECRVLSFDGWGRKGSDSLPVSVDTERVHRVRGKADPSEATAWAIAEKPRLIHVHDPRLWELGGEIAGALGGTTPRVYTLHVLAAEQDRVRGLEQPTRAALCEARALAEADRVIAPSAAVAALVRSNARVRIARLGVADHPVAESRGGKRMIFVGRFTDITGIDDVVTMVKELPRDATLVVAGGLPDNPRSQDRWRATLAREAERCGLALEMPGWLSAEDVRAELARADVMIAPNKVATFGLAVAEAMLARLPVCAYEVGGLVDLIEDGVSGRLVPTNPALLAAAVRDLLADPEEARRLGANARRRVLEELDAERATAELRAVYDELD